MNTPEQENLARKLLVEQTKKELLDDIKQYMVGMIVRSEFIVKKNAPLDGWVIIIPDDKYKELFGNK